MTSVARESVSDGPVDRSAAELCSSDDLARAWKTVVRGYTHVTDLLTEQVERETGLPAPAFFALVWLLRDGSGSAVPLSTLARQVAFTSGGFTKVADRLEQAALIQRQPSVSDRRVTHAVLTEAGRALAERAFGIYCAGLRELVVERLGLDGLYVLADHMQRLSGDMPE
ncbi:MAG TPA: MarR family transcriptional regulator [Streptosporangiaceae bacterium]|nr:MarR family transcriptional regulator [Streptosporangiaceae bacterium]